ncbi:bactofilin family protein [Thaumasiovibrio sp. DFM-14]|uniref:bactofilin family protein n=1 Tax=Thaumasiovibrio sp. DFM-14 TaxID=3384792 RepID=UPI0039A0D706
MGIFGKESGTTSQFTTATVIAKGCSIKGELQLACDIQVDGFIEGKLRSDKSLVISNDGRVKGEVYSDKIMVNGLLEGNVYANEIEILELGKVTGTIYCDNLSIEKGGSFLGETLPTQKEHVVSLGNKDVGKTTASAAQAPQKMQATK